MDEVVVAVRRPVGVAPSPASPVVVTRARALGIPDVEDRGAVVARVRANPAASKFHLWPARRRGEGLDARCLVGVHLVGVVEVVEVGLEKSVRPPAE